MAILPTVPAHPPFTAAYIKLSMEVSPADSPDTSDIEDMRSKLSASYIFIKLSISGY